MARLIELDGVSAGYGDAVVVEDVSLALDEGDSVALLGRNGVGKTTLLTTLMGLTRLHAGRILWKGRDISRSAPYERAALGLGWVPQERFMFASLTVAEHLGAVARPGHWNAERVFALFPQLAARRGHLGNQLSGGEQQMLAIGRALMVNPALLLLDEPMEGLAPIIVQELARVVRRIVAESGVALLLVEQHARLALGLTRQAVVLERGRIAHRAASETLLADAPTLHRLVSVA